MKHTFPKEDCKLCKQPLEMYILEELKAAMDMVFWDELFVYIFFQAMIFGFTFQVFDDIWLQIPSGILLGRAFWFLMAENQGGAIAGVFDRTYNWSENNFCHKCHLRLKNCICKTSSPLKD